MNPETLEEPTFQQTCAHEAGHAAVCVLLGVPVRLVDVTGDETALGRTHHELRDTDDDLATRMKIILGGLIESAEHITDLPSWPLNPDHGTTDQRRLALLAQALHLDSAEYGDIVDETLELWQSPKYKRTHAAISVALERHGQLDRHALNQIKAVIEGANMEHLTLKAVTTTTTDQGLFEAVISTESVDREKDVVDASAMVTALRKWNRPIPLAWNHSSAAEDIIGAIDPQTVREVHGEVVAGGEVDLDSRVGSEAWRSFKSRTIGFSFGYLILTASKRAGGGRHITELDIFEITSTPTPMNNATRVLSTKGIRVGDSMLDVINRACAHAEEVHRKQLDADVLREKSLRLAREFAPIQVATYEC